MGMKYLTGIAALFSSTLGRDLCGSECSAIMKRLDFLEDKVVELSTQNEEMKLSIDKADTSAYDFKYYVSNGNNAIRQDTIINFDTPVYGSGVTEGVFTVPVTGTWEITYHINLMYSTSYWVDFSLRKNGRTEQVDMFNIQTKQTQETTFNSKYVADLKKDDWIVLIPEATAETYSLQPVRYCSF